MVGRGRVPWPVGRGRVARREGCGRRAGSPAPSLLFAIAGCYVCIYIYMYIYPNAPTSDPPCLPIPMPPSPPCSLSLIPKSLMIHSHSHSHTQTQSHSDASVVRLTLRLTDTQGPYTSDVLTLRLLLVGRTHSDLSDMGANCEDASIIFPVSVPTGKPPPVVPEGRPRGAHTREWITVLDSHGPPVSNACAAEVSEMF